MTSDGRVKKFKVIELKTLKSNDAFLNFLIHWC